MTRSLCVVYCCLRMLFVKRCRKNRKGHFCSISKKEVLCPRATLLKSYALKFQILSSFIITIHSIFTTMELLWFNCEIKIYQDSVANVAGYTNVKIVLKYLRTVSNLVLEKRYIKKRFRNWCPNLQTWINKILHCVRPFFFSLIFTLVILDLSRNFCVKNV